MQQMGTRLESGNGEIIYNLRGGTAVLKGIVELVLVVVIIGMLLGFALSRNELFNPTITIEQARRLEVENNSLAAKNTFEQRKQQIELDRQRALVQQELTWREQDHQRWQKFWEDAATLVLFTFSASWVVMSIGISVYIGCLGVARLRQQHQRSSPKGQAETRFPIAPDHRVESPGGEIGFGVSAARSDDHGGKEVLKQYDREQLRAQLKVTAQSSR